LCTELLEPPGLLCDLGGEPGICDGGGTCVECIEDADCASGLCVGGVCEGGTLVGACGDNLCQVLPASPECFECIANAQACSMEVTVCGNDSPNQDCISCFDFVNGEGKPTCPGSVEKAQAFLDCLCLGPCANF
jgi:hypothetical protein